MNPEGGRQAEQSSTIRPTIEAVLQHDKTRFAHLERGFRDQGQDNSIKERRQKTLDRLADRANPPDDKDRRDLTLQVAWSDFWLPSRDETKNLLPTELSAQIRTRVQTEILANDQDPTNSEAHALIARTLTKDARFEPDKVIRKQLHEEARKSFEEALINDPDNALANLFLNVPREDLEATQLALAQKGQKQSLTTEENIRLSEITDAIQFQQELGLNDDTSLKKWQERGIKAGYITGGVVWGLGINSVLGGIAGHHLAEQHIERINGKRADSKGRRRGEPPQTGTGNQQPEQPMRLLNQDVARHDRRQEVLTQRFNGEAAVDGQLRVTAKRAGDHYVIIGGDASQSFSGVFTLEAAQELLINLQTSPDAARTALSAIGINIDLNQDTQFIGDQTDPVVKNRQLLEATSTEAQSRRETERARTELENRIEQHISQLITLQEESTIIGVPGENDRSRYSTRTRNEATGIYSFGRQPTYELATPVNPPDSSSKTHAVALVYAMETKIAEIAEAQKPGWKKVFTPKVKPQHPSPVPIILHETRNDEAAGTQEFIIQVAQHTTEKPNVNDVAVTTLVFKDQSAYKAILDLLQENNNANLADALKFLIQRTDPRSTWNQTTLSSGIPPVTPPPASSTGGSLYRGPAPYPAPSQVSRAQPAAAPFPAPAQRLEARPQPAPEPVPARTEAGPTPAEVARLVTDPAALAELLASEPDNINAREASAIIKVAGGDTDGDLPDSLPAIDAAIAELRKQNGQTDQLTNLVDYRDTLAAVLEEERA